MHFSCAQDAGKTTRTKFWFSTPTVSNMGEDSHNERDNLCGMYEIKFITDFIWRWNAETTKINNLNK